MNDQKKTGVVTIHDVAARADVSITTVSRVMNKSDKVSAATSARVLRAIEELGYVPNEMARGLATSRNNMIGMLIPDIFNGYYAELTTYIEPYLSQRGYSLQMCITHAEPPLVEYYIDDLFSRRAAGVIIVSSSTLSDTLMQKIRRNVLAVSIEGRIDGVDRISVDGETGMQLAVENLIRKGHTRIGYVGYDFQMERLSERLESYCRALRAHGLPVDPRYIIDEGNAVNPGYAAVEKLLELEERPTAIQCMNEYCAQGAYLALMERGLRIPEDMSVSAFDGQRSARVLRPRLTTIATPIRQLAESAADLLLNRIQGVSGQSCQDIVLPVSFRDGDSVRDLCRDAASCADAGKGT